MFQIACVKGDECRIACRLAQRRCRGEPLGDDQVRPANLAYLVEVALLRRPKKEALAAVDIDELQSAKHALPVAHRDHELRPVLQEAVRLDALRRR